MHDIIRVQRQCGELEARVCEPSNCCKIRSSSAAMQATSSLTVHFDARGYWQRDHGQSSTIATVIWCTEAGRRTMYCVCAEYTNYIAVYFAHGVPTSRTHPVGSAKKKKILFDGAIPLLHTPQERLPPLTASSCTGTAEHALLQQTAVLTRYDTLRSRSMCRFKGVRNWRLENDKMTVGSSSNVFV